jgi:hypothetical protein
MGNIKNFCSKIGFPEEATEYFCGLIEKIGADTFDEAIATYVSAETDDYKPLTKAIADANGISVYTADMIMLILAAQPLKEKFAENGYSEELFYDTMCDLTYKVNECKKLHDIWGTFVTDWFRWFYQLNRFTLGRLQFEKKPAVFDYKDKIKKGDLIINIHNPSSGPITPEAVADSLRKAYEFYGCEGEMIVSCSSWMIYPPHYDLFPENSNLRKFYDLFEILDTKETGTNDLWRFFYKEKFEDITEDDIKTRLHRNFYEFIKSGNQMGAGIGVIVYNK